MTTQISANQMPEVLTVEEAAAVLRIGRGCAYALARRWRATGGREGLPVIELGRHLRVPRAALQRLLEVQNEEGNDVDAVGLPRVHAS